MNALTSLRDDCTAEGVNCHECVEHAAHNIAAVCLEMEGKSLERMYLSLYRKRSCRKMFRQFETRYEAHAERVLLQIRQVEFAARAVA